MLLFSDGFNHYGNLLEGTDLLEKWSAIEGGGSSYRTTGRLSGLAALSMDGAGNYRRLKKSFGQTYEELIVGVALKRVATSYPTMTFLEFWSSGSLQVQIRSASDGAVEVATDPNASSALAVSSKKMAHGYWYYVEVRVYPHPTSGSIHIRVDGADWLQQTGLNLAPTASGADTIALVDDTDAYSRTVFADLYVQDNSYTTNNDFLGDTYVLLYLPNASAQAEWSPVGASTNVEAIAEQFHDDDATYIAASTVNLEDRYYIAQYGTSYDVSSGSVRGMLMWHWARMDSGSGQLTGVLVRRIGSASYGKMSAPMTITGTYAYASYSVQQDDVPGGGEWSACSLADTEFGFVREQ